MRKPDLIIGPADHPYMLRWTVFRWRGWQLALHNIRRSDDDRALHDHVGWNLSFVLRGAGYREILSHAWEPVRARIVRRWRFAARSAFAPHRLELPFGPVWTLWLRGPQVKEWGFYCPKGWKHWKQYIGEQDYYKAGTSTLTHGCD